jgi:DNA-binding NarL/FixJ family response regulator
VFHRHAIAPALWPSLATGPGGCITRREREIAALIAEGLTNAELGDRLTLTEGTIGNHVAHILRKLGLKSRTQIAVWAVERGLYRSGDEAEER